MDTANLWIAVVDDEEAVRRALLRLFAAADLPAQGFACGADLLSILAGNPPCCVLLDLQMPGMDGFAVLAHLKQNAPGLAVVTMSAQLNPDIATRATGAGASIHLLKPMSDQAILNAIAPHWRHHVGL